MYTKEFVEKVSKAKEIQELEGENEEFEKREKELIQQIEFWKFKFYREGNNGK